MASSESWQLRCFEFGAYSFFSMYMQVFLDLKAPDANATPAKAIYLLGILPSKHNSRRYSCFGFVFIFQHPTSSSSATSLQLRDLCEHRFKLRCPFWCVAVSVEMIDQHLRMHLPSLKYEIVSYHLDEIRTPRSRSIATGSDPFRAIGDP